MPDPLAILLAEKLILWWNAEDPDRRLGPDSAHDLADVVTLAYLLLARAEAGLEVPPLPAPITPQGEEEEEEQWWLLKPEPPGE